MKKLITYAVGLALAFAATDAVLAAQPQMTPAAQETRSDQPGTDTWITAKVKAELMATKDISSTNISVTTTNGVVMLSGMLDTKAQVRKSVSVARAVKGVHHVDAAALKSKD
jgi:hyperosmotically inducible protein